MSLNDAIEAIPFGAGISVRAAAAAGVGESYEISMEVGFGRLPSLN